MTSHRAEGRRAPQVDSPAAGRRRASRLSRRSHGLTTASVAGGLVLLVAGVGATTADQALSTTSQSAPPASPDQAAYVAPLSGASVGDHAAVQAKQVSRSATRPPLVTRRASQSAALRRAETRSAKLDTAADDAAKYSNELDRAAREERQQQRAEERAARRKAARQQAAATTTEAPAASAAPTTSVAPAPSGQWVLPTSNFRISTWFGEAGPYWSSGYHTGIDFATAYGTPLVAVDNATVAQSGYDGAYGNQVRLELENGDQVWYNHLSSIEVTAGQSVSQGQEIGLVGETGNAYGAHLHFEYRLASDLGTGVDPRPFFLEHGITL